MLYDIIQHTDPQWMIFFHEHPLEATLWKEECVQRILGQHGVMRVSADQCQYGFASRAAQGVGAVRKVIGFMTNSFAIAIQFQKGCPNRAGKDHHRHVVLEGDRTKPAQIYFEGMYMIVYRDLVEQIQMDRKEEFIIA